VALDAIISAASHAAKKFVNRSPFRCWPN